MRSSPRSSANASKGGDRMQQRNQKDLQHDETTERIAPASKERGEAGDGGDRRRSSGDAPGPEVPRSLGGARRSREISSTDLRRADPEGPGEDRGEGLGGGSPAADQSPDDSSEDLAPAARRDPLRRSGGGPGRRGAGASAENPQGRLEGPPLLPADAWQGARLRLRAGRQRLRGRRSLATVGAAPAARREGRLA